MPLAIWASGIADFDMHRRVIKADQELSHANSLILDAAFVYSQAVAYLIHNATEDDRATKAFEFAVGLAKNLAKSEKDGESVSGWLQIAQDSADKYSR